MWGAIVGAAVLLAVTLVPGIALRCWSVTRMRRACRGRLVLTYDDGPSAAPTPQLLDLLRRYGARATFFLLGRSAERAPALCDRLVAEGHEIAAHGYEHRHAWRDPVRAVADLRRGIRAIRPWRARDPLFRPPFGKTTLWTALAARSAGARTVWWTIESQDSWAAQPELDAVVGEVERRQGGVVLMHDFERDPASPSARYTLGLTERLLRVAAERGWKTCTVSELLANAGGEPRTGDDRRVAAERARSSAAP